MGFFICFKSRSSVLSLDETLNVICNFWFSANETLAASYTKSNDPVVESIAKERFLGNAPRLQIARSYLREMCSVELTTKRRSVILFSELNAQGILYKALRRAGIKDTYVCGIPLRCTMYVISIDKPDSYKIWINGKEYKK